MTNIEILKAQVDQVKTDLDLLKTETNEASRKSKAELAADKVKNAKEEITKRLEALKWFTDAKSLADIGRLETMLKTLENSSNALDQLKNSVVTPIEAPKPKETVDNTADLTNITNGIAGLKALVTELQTIIDEYIKQKSTMNEVQKTAKEQEIAQKKIVIEAKRKEVQEIIDRIRKGRKDFKMDTITDADMKKAMTEQKNKEETSLANYENELKAINTPVSWFWEKVKNGAEKAWERGKENPGKAIAVTAGIGLLVWWISKLFGKKKKEKSEEGEKEEKKSRWKKALMWVWIGTWWLLIRKNRDSIKNWFNGLFSKETPSNWPDISSEFNTLPENEKEEYRATSESVDEFSKTNIDINTVVSFSENEQENKERKASIIHWLDKEAENLQAFTSNSTLDYISWETTDGPIESIMNWSKDKMHKLLLPFLSGLESFKPFGAEFISHPAETLENWLKWGEAWERKRILSLYYREYMNIINYAVEKKKILEEKLAKQEVMKIRINEEPTEKEQEAIEDLLDNDERRKWKLDSFFKSHKLKDLPALCKEYGIETSEVSKDTQELLTSIQEEKDDILQKDDDGETVFSRAETDLADGSLENDSKAELDKTCKELLDIEFWDNSKSLFGAYTHLITDIFRGNKELTDSFMEKTKLKEVSEEFKANLEWYRAKIKAWTFSAEDLKNMKNQTETYLNAKKQYEITMKNIDNMSDGVNINRWKILSLPLDAIKDIGKAIGTWKTNSRRERIGYGLWWCYVLGQTLYIWSKIIPWWTLVWQAARMWAWWIGKVWIKIGKLPITVAESWLKLLTWRTHLTSWWRSKYLKGASHLNDLEKADVLKYAFLNGEMSESWVLSVARKLKIASSPWGRINSIDEILSKWWLSDPKQVELFKKYRKNKNIRELLIKKSPINNLRLFDNIKYTLKDKILKLEMGFNADNFTKLQKIEENIKNLWVWPKEKLFWEAFMQNTKTLDRVDELMCNQRLTWLIAEIWTSSDDYIRISKTLAKEFHTFSSLDEFEKYLQFLKSNKANIKNTNTFIRNSIWKRSTIKTMDAAAQSKYIETAKLNTSFLDRRINGMKENFKKSAETLKNLIKNKRTPYTASVESVAKGLENIATTDNETLAAMQAAPEIGEWGWLVKMSKNKQLMQEIMPLFKNKEFVKEIAQAKNTESIKAVFEKFGKKLPDTIPEEFVNSLAKTKSTKKITDTMKYIEKYEELTKIQKILKAPGMKYASRVFGRALSIVGFGFGAYTAVGKFNEATEIAKTNQERAAVKKADAWFESGYAVAAGVEALWAFGALAGIESVCAFVPGVWWIVGGVILGVSYFAKEVIFETLDKYNKNYKDLLGQAPLLIREHIISTILWGAKEDRSFGDWTVGIFKNMEHLSKKTWSEGIKALLYTEEWKQNQLAMIDINDTQLMDKLEKENPPITRTQVAEAVNQVEKNVKARYDYLAKRCGVYTVDGVQYVDLKKIISPDAIKNWIWLHALDKLLIESQYGIANPETFGDPQKIEQQQKTTKETLDKEQEKFKTLESLCIKDPISMLYIYRYINEYRQHLQQFGFDESGENKEPAYEAIVKNMEYFDTYMGYKIMEEGIEVNAYSSSFLAPNFVILRDFFVSYKLEQQISDKELYNSTSKLQTILYRIATEVVWAKINNSMDDIKNIFNETNEKAYGIYFHDNKLDINGNYFADTEYMWTDIATIKKIRADIVEQVKDNDLIDIWTGDTYLNKEIGNAYIRIIDQEVART